MSDDNVEDSRSGRRIGRVFPQEWLRGPALIDGEWIVLDTTRARTYNPIGEADLMYDLAAVRRPPDALAFVQRYGLLHHGPDHDAHRERYRDIEAEARTLSTILQLYTAINVATGDDAEQANDAIRELWRHEETELRPLFESPATNDDDVINQASFVATWLTNRGLEGVDFKVEPAFTHGGGRGDFSLSAWSPTLLGEVYHQLALTVVNRIPLRACVECGRYFEVTDKRQQFCSTTCSSRARQRRYAEKKKLAATEEKP